MLPTMFRGDLPTHSGKSGLVLRTGPLRPSPERRPRWSPWARIIPVRRLHRRVFQTFAFDSRDLKGNEEPKNEAIKEKLYQQLVACRQHLIKALALAPLFLAAALLPFGPAAHARSTRMQQPPQDMQTMHTDAWHRAAERSESAWLSKGRIAPEESPAAKQGGYMSGFSTNLGGLRGKGLDHLQMGSETQAGGLTSVATIAAVLGAAAIMLFAWQRSQMLPKHSSSDSGGGSNQGSQGALQKEIPDEALHGSSVAVGSAAFFDSDLSNDVPSTGAPSIRRDANPAQLRDQIDRVDRFRKATAAAQNSLNVTGSGSSNSSMNGNNGRQAPQDYFTIGSSGLSTGFGDLAGGGLGGTTALNDGSFTVPTSEGGNEREGEPDAAFISYGRQFDSQKNQQRLQESGTGGNGYVEGIPGRENASPHLAVSRIDVKNAAIPFLLLLTAASAAVDIARKVSKSDAEPCIPAGRCMLFSREGNCMMVSSMPAAPSPPLQVLSQRQASLAVPTRTLNKYDFVGSLLQGLLSADFDAPGASKYDMVWDLLHGGRSSGVMAESNMDDFRRSARAVLGATSWDIAEGEDSEDTLFDPIAALLFIRLSAPTVRSKYDPFQAALALIPPKGDKYDLWRAVVEAALAVPESTPLNDPASALLRTLTAFCTPPTERRTLDSAAALSTPQTGVSTPPTTQRFQWDPMSSLNDAARLFTAPQSSKYDMLPALIRAANAMKAPERLPFKYDMLPAILHTARNGFKVTELMSARSAEARNAFRRAVGIPERPHHPPGSGTTLAIGKPGEGGKTAHGSASDGDPHTSQWRLSNFLTNKAVVSAPLSAQHAAVSSPAQPTSELLVEVESAPTSYTQSSLPGIITGGHPEKAAAWPPSSGTSDSAASITPSSSRVSPFEAQMGGQPNRSGTPAGRPFDRQVVGDVPQPASAHGSVVEDATDVQRKAVATAYDPVPDLLRLWAAVECNNLQLGPREAEAVLVARCPGDSFTAVASSFRGMVGDEELRRAHTAVFTLMTSGSAATHTPYPPSIAAMDAVNALLVDAKLQYQSVTCILEGRDSIQQMEALCAMSHLLMTPDSQHRPVAVPLHATHSN